MEIGNKIKQLRFKSGLTQEQLAGKLGVSPQSVSKWETSITMPDITLLPIIAGEFGVTIDELFDLTTEQTLHRIETRIDIEEEITPYHFKEYEDFLKDQLLEYEDKKHILSLLAHLYHHRMEADARRVSKYAREAIKLKPEEKDCQWLLQMAEGQYKWDWNTSNHSSIINFYKDVIESDKITPKTPLPYYYVIDNLIADHRTKEAAEYLEIYQTLPAHKPFLVSIYKAYLALAEYDEPRADSIIQEAQKNYSDDGDFLFEVAQYYARKCEYEKAITFYELSWTQKESQKPRYTDTLEGIATIYEIMGDTNKAADTYDRLLDNLKNEWGFSDGDKLVIEVENKKKELLKK